MSSTRESNVYKFIIFDTQTDSGTVDLDGGAFGTLLVPVGSDAIGKTLQFVAVDDSRAVNGYADTNLLSTAKTLTVGANALTSDELLEMGAAKRVKISLNSAVSGDVSIFLLWKS